MKKSIRRGLSAGTVVVLTSALASAGSPASGADIRTETDLGGFSIHTDAAPFKVLVDDPANPIPRDLDSPIVEADPAYSQADLGTGPSARGIGSILWPGGLLGSGVGTATNGAIPSYPLKAEGRYPDNPHEEVKQDNGAFMRGSALGLDVIGTAKMNPADVPGTIDLGIAASTSTATVKDGVAIGKAVSRVADVALLGDTIKVKSVSTTLSVESTGSKATSTGATVVSGLEVAGVGYVVDEKGARPTGPVNDGAPLPGIPDPAKALGITFSAVTQVATKSNDTATRDASGLRITVNTAVLRGILNQTPSPITEALYSLFAQTPAQVQGYLYYTLAATPKITFILGAGTGRAAAALPLSFDFPDTPVTGGLPPVTGGGPLPAGPTTTDPLPGVDPGTGAPGPVIVPTTPNTVKAAAKDPFKGVSPALLLLVAVAAGVAGWGLSRLQTLAFTAVGTARCTDGTSTNLPDLRGD